MLYELKESDGQRARLHRVDDTHIAYTRRKTTLTRNRTYNVNTR